MSSTAVAPSWGADDAVTHEAVLEVMAAKARVEIAHGQFDEAIETLDHALARAPRADWTERARVHMLLGELYEAAERLDIAFEHYAYVAAQEHTHETKMRDRATARLAERQDR